MRQKLLASLLSVCLLFSLLPASALAANLDDGLTPITDENEDATTPENTNQDETSTDPENQENPETSSDNAGENVDITENITSEETNVEPVNDVAPLAGETETVASELPTIDKDGKITLTTPVNLATTYTVSGTVTLDLNGQTLTVAGSPGIKVPVGAKLTIKDSTNKNEGVIQRTNNVNGYIVENNGSLELQGGTIKLVSTNPQEPYTASALANRAAGATTAVMTIENGVVEADYIAIKNDRASGNQIPELTIKGGLVAAGHDQAVQNWGKATIEGGKFSGCVATWTSGDECGETTISGGTFNMEGSAITPKAVLIVTRYYDDTSKKQPAKLTISGSINVSDEGYTNKGVAAVAVTQRTSNGHEEIKPADIPEEIKVSITGGTYHTDVSAFVPDLTKHTCTSNGDGTWTVKEANGLVGDKTEGEGGSTVITITGSAAGTSKPEGDGLSGSTNNVTVNATDTTATKPNAEVKIPADTAATMKDNTNSITVTANNVTVTLPEKSVAKIADAGSGDEGKEVTITVKDDNQSSGDVKAQYTIGVTTTTVTGTTTAKPSLLPPGKENGTITIQVPAPAGVTSDDTCFVYYVVNNIRKQLMKSSFVNGLITIETDHLSTYQILNKKDTTIDEAAYIDATDGQQKTGTLAQAIANAATGSTITLNKDVELSAPIAIEGKDVTIEGIDNTITPADNFTGDSLIEIKKDGTNEATVTLDGVTVDASDNADVTAVKCDEGANLTVDGGDISDVFVEPGANVTTTQDDTIGKVQIALDDPTNANRVVVEIENPKATGTEDPDKAITGRAIPAGETATVVKGSTITSNVTIGKDATLDIPENVTITVKPDSNGTLPTITNNGTVKVDGKLEAEATPGIKTDVPMSGTGDVTGEVQLPTANYVTITLELDGGIYAGALTISVPKNQSVELPTADDVTRTGYAFGGWMNSNYIKVESPYTPSNSETLRANWIANRYTVTFHDYDGYGNTTTQTIEHNATASNPAITRPGYVLNGWYEESSWSTLWNFGTPITGPKNLYARWSRIPVSNLTLNQTSYTLYLGQTLQLRAIITPDNADASVVWTTGNSSVASVDRNTGLVTAYSAGTATITATASDGWSATCTVTVLDSYYPYYIGGGSTTIRRPSTSTPSASPAPSESPAPSTPPSTTSKPTVTFTDVAKDAWYYDAVAWAVENKITTGINDTTFAPNAECTRAQIVAFLYRYAGEPEVEAADNPFTDVAENSWYYKAVQWAVANGITTGVTADTFYPEAEVTRAQTFTFLYRFIKGQVSSGAENPFTDVNTDTWYTEAVLWAAENGITTGVTATTFAPESVCERSQIVTILYRVDQKQN